MLKIYTDMYKEYFFPVCFAVIVDTSQTPFALCRACSL